MWSSSLSFSLWSSLLFGVASSLSAPSTRTRTLVVTHAAGRMGKLLAGQVREETFTSEDGRPVDVRVRAVVRSEEEARSVRCDLAGMMTVNGASTFREHDDWLEVVVVPDDDRRDRRMEAVLEGAAAAVLCDASHNELVRSDVGRWSLRVPAEDLTGRLLAEIRAARKSTALEHVVLRSSMGTRLLRERNPSRAVVEAVDVMGGAAALRGPERAEAALLDDDDDDGTSWSPDLSVAVLRLGALTDDAGPMPLVFGPGDDSILLERIEGDEDARRPPMISRADAARAAVAILKDHGRRRPTSPTQRRAIVDCAWAANLTPSSVGSEEALRAAHRQDVAKDVREKCRLV